MAASSTKRILLTGMGGGLAGLALKALQESGMDVVVAEDATAYHRTDLPHHIDDYNEAPPIPYGGDKRPRRRGNALSPAQRLLEQQRKNRAQR